MKKVGRFAVAMALAANAATAQPLSQQETDAAQLAMGDRVQRAASAYAAKIGLDRYWASYCTTQLRIFVATQPANGLIPFGVDYHAIDKPTLDTVLGLREAYERSSILKCLADAKNALRAAEAP